VLAQILSSEFFSSHKLLAKLLARAPIWHPSENYHFCSQFKKIVLFVADLEKFKGTMKELRQRIDDLFVHEF